MDYATMLAKKSKAQLIGMLVKEKAVLISTPGEITPLILAELEKFQCLEQENFIVITLDGSHKVIKAHLASQGLVDRCLVHPREVFRWALTDNATAIIVAHNHPSGILTPSIEDRDTTKRLKLAGDIIGVKVLDHVIVGNSVGYYSLLENNIF